MTVVLSAPTFNWALTRERIAEKALEKINELNPGETASSDSMNLAIEALDGVIKMLQFEGLTWPKISRGQVDLTLFKEQQQHELPSDYYGFADINFLGEDEAVPQEIRLELLLASEWHELHDKNKRGRWPRNGFIDNHNILWIWPILTDNVQCKMFYQKIIEDSRSGTSPLDLRSPWSMALVYGVADEIAEEFRVSDAKIRRLNAKWTYYRELCLMNEVEHTQFNPTVR